ncbi:MAG TPA: hypothetical protein VE152_05660 [Acidimicrobiales bacterium]|nr:hypothetical protein [Acidimicrobiales bacterium]
MTHPTPPAPTAAQGATPLTQPLAAAADDLPWTALGNRQGITLREFPFCRPDAGIRLRASIGRLGPDIFSPRHRHTFDQVRYMLAGHTMVGDEVYGPGDCGYFPEGAVYGPQVPHEGETALQITLQFPGPARIFYPSPEEQQRAVEELGKVGTFRAGTYVRDGVETDSFEAVLTHLTGVPTTYPAPRITAPVLVHGDLVPWEPTTEAGVSARDLGCFTGLGPHIELVHAEAGAGLPPSPPGWAEFRFVTEGRVTHGGAPYEAVSGFYSPAYLGYGPMVAATDATLLVVRLAGDAPSPGTPRPR